MTKKYITDPVDSEKLFKIQAEQLMTRDALIQSQNGRIEGLQKRNGILEELNGELSHTVQLLTEQNSLLEETCEDQQKLLDECSDLLKELHGHY